MKEWIKKAKKAAREKNYSQAGDFYYLAGDMEKALNMYLRGEHYDLAAKLFEKIGDIAEAANYYRKAKDYISAGDCYQRAKNYKEASLMYQLGRDYYKAAEMSHKRGDFLRAAQMMEKTTYLDKAAFLYMKVKHDLKAAEIFEELYTSYKQKKSPYKELTSQEVEKFNEYGRLSAEEYLKAGKNDKAAYYFEELGFYDKAAEVYRLSGELQKELECYIKRQNYPKALELLNENSSLKVDLGLMAELYRGTGEYKKAAEYYLKAGKIEKAAESFQLAGDYQQAAKLGEELGFFQRAAGLYAKAGNNKKAAQLYEKEGDIRSAAELYYEEKEYSKAAALYLRAEEYMQAVDIFYRLKDRGNYIETLQKVPEDSSDYRKACLMLGNAFIEKELYSVAEKKLLEALPGEEVNNRTVAVYYSLGIIYEKLNQLDKAKDIFEKIVSFNYKYKDVAERMEKLKDLSSLAATQPIDDTLINSIRVESGTIIANRYNIKKTIGQGGMGRVFLVHDMHLDELIALKLLIPYQIGESDQVERFIREIKISRKINHPNVIRVFDLEKWHMNHFITMEYVDGGNLKDWMKQNPEDRDGRIHFLMQICEGLYAAHRLNIIHRDIKPENILIDKGNIAKIVDFGIARSATITSKTMDGRLIGTPEFISPEQIHGQNLDEKSDIYSLGVLMYQLFTGKLPFTASNIGQILLKHLNEKPIPPKEINPKVPAWLDEIILKALEKDPAKRFQNTKEIIKEIKAHWHEAEE
jgi:tetratricopeptide (TPR) repeat protein